MSSSNNSSIFSSSSKLSSSPCVLSVQCLKGSSKGDEWTGDMLQTGDIVEELRIGNLTIAAPFKNGKAGVQKLLHTSFKAKETSVRVRVRRGAGDFAELLACLVPNESVGRKQYVLRAIDDPNYAVGFVDRTESECLDLQGSRTSRMVAALAKTPMQDGYVSYPWEKRMAEMLAVPNSSSFYSMLLLPKATDKVSFRYNDVEDTLARANAWLNASQASGVPIVFMNIQTESLLTKGFIYVSSVIQGNEAAPSTRSGLSSLYEEASKQSKLLVVSRISNQKVLPWMASTAGAIRCFDTVSLSQKLSLHRHARVPILIHVFLWDRSVCIPSCGSIRSRAVPPLQAAPPRQQEVAVGVARVQRESQVMPVMVPDEEEDARRLERDTAGETSFRFHDFALPNNWV